MIHYKMSLQARRFAGSIPDGVIGIFHWHNPYGRTVALGLTQSLTEMSTRNISWEVKAASAYGWQPYHHYVPIVLKSGSLKLLEPSGTVQACNGIVIAFQWQQCYANAPQSYVICTLHVLLVLTCEKYGNICTRCNIGLPGCKWEDDTELYLKNLAVGVRSGCLDYRIDTVINFLVPWRAKSFLATWTYIHFLRFGRPCIVV